MGEMRRMRVGILGEGQIARHVHATLRDGENAAIYDVVAMIGRTDPVPAGLDLLVEAATQQAVAERLPAVIASGVDVLLLSVGALTDPTLRENLAGGPGRLIACSGAVGGLDQIRALRMEGALDHVGIESRKLPATLIQPWMDEDLRARLLLGVDEIVLADGPVAEITRQFPASANVAASLALAADAWDTARARVIADPAATRTRHALHASGGLGSVTVVVENEPSLERPRSSAVVARAVLRSLGDLARLRGFAPAGSILVL